MMDCIMKFLRLENTLTNMKRSSILTVIDKFTKYAYLIQYSKGLTVKQIFWVISNKVIQHCRILEKIVFGRNRLFLIVSDKH